ncbi:MAG: BREX-1 system phosphatase PglZ type B [Chloroflexota bacterium]
MVQTLIESLVASLQSASAYNANDVSAPAAVLWTDKDRQWGALLPALRARLPLLTYGTYDPETRTGPAYWLRCMIARTLAADPLPADATPIIYLPGVSRQEMRAVEDCPRELQPLAELQYRGVLWSQRNGKDWTIAAFLQSVLNIEVAGDAATREALQRSLLKLAETSIETLQQQAPLKASWLDNLLHPDEVRSLLSWMNNPAGHRQNLSAQDAQGHLWQAFCNLCRQKYRFDPGRDGELVAADLLGTENGPWDVVWERYKESPQAYPHIASLLGQVAPPPDFFDLSERWPTHNESAEEQLRLDLEHVGASVSLANARSLIQNLENTHGQRRKWAWAKIGLAPLAQALEVLARLAQQTERPLPGSSLEELSSAYLEWAWQVDAAALEALAIAGKSALSSDLLVIKSSLAILYKPWLEAAARQFRNLVETDGYPYQAFGLPMPGTCILFSDALRMDNAQKLTELLEGAGLQTELIGRWAALPPVTSTSKPAFSPNQNLMNGANSRNLNPSPANRDTALTADIFRSLLESQNFQILRGDDPGQNTSGLGWTELGQIDSYGHEHGSKLALHLEAELGALASRINALLEHGWARVQVVTDHGWLLLPGGLPKAHLPEHLTELRKGRCARLKVEARCDYFSLPWHWDQTVNIAYAPDIQCFEAGREYEHGGLSLQECFTPLLTVTSASGASTNITISEVKWRGLRCQVKLNAALPNLMVDLRTRPADETTSLLSAPKAIDENGHASLAVEDDDLNGTAAVIVVLNASGQLCTQIATLIGA